MTRPFARRSAATIALCLSAATTAYAGGTPENALLVVDPINAESLYVANYYRAARDIPADNMLFMAPGASSYSAWVDFQRAGFFGWLSASGKRSVIDYVVIPPGPSFSVSASGLVTDTCAPVNRFAIASCYTLANQSDVILAGGLPSTWRNQYSLVNSNTPLPFDSETFYSNGSVDDTAPNAQRYFIGAMLGYSGERGNTIAETLAMIDRSAAVDGTQPAGTFYYMKTTDPARSGPRDPNFPGAINAILSFGGNAEQIDDVLPLGKDDCLGIMTGWATPDIDGGNFTILPGAFCDHLTSYAGAFNLSSQTKMSRWIAKGASGSWGAVEEPCNYPGKFPHPRVHVYYYQGASLGEAALRSAAHAPFQMLLYGDPLTRPHATIPTVTLLNPPSGPVSGQQFLIFSVVHQTPGISTRRSRLLIDGVEFALIEGTGSVFIVDTTQLSDGWHDLRIIAEDIKPAGNVGRWIGEYVVNNHGASAALTVSPTAGDLDTAFTCSASAVANDLRELRILHGGRVIAATTAASGDLTVYGRTIGAGPAQLQAEALLMDGTTVRSAPFTVDVAFAGGAGASVRPLTYDFTKVLTSREPVIVELPATTNGADAVAYTVTSAPAQATVAGNTSMPYRLIRPDPTATGTDTFTFVANANGISPTTTVTLIYPGCPGDLDGDSRTDFNDFAALAACWGQPCADLTGDATTDFADFAELTASWNCGVTP